MRRHRERLEELVAEGTTELASVNKQLQEDITKPAGEGTGLGLNIVRQIIEKHQSQIDLASQTGRTTFRVWLPVEEVGDKE